jgi:3-phenylpropionate/cinnamic acid dioxygenase small subunit
MTDTAASPAIHPAIGATTSPERYLEVLQFLYAEAALLDARRYEEWLELLCDDLTYEMPLTLTRDGSEQQRVHDHQMEYFSENLASIKMRIRRLGTEYAWAEDPPTRTRHLVSNVVVREVESGEVVAACAFCVFANRGTRPDYELLVGNREDVLRRENGHLKLARRTLWLDQAVLGANSISIIL